jgi:uncharacterized protein YfeS
MKVGIEIRNYNTWGGNLTYSLAGTYLQRGLRDYGPAVREIEMMACFEGGRLDHPSLRRMYDEYHRGYLARLPIINFRRKKARFELYYLTKVARGSFLDRAGPANSKIFAKVVQEAAKQLILLDSKLTKADPFDLKQFHEDLARLAEQAPTSARGVKAIEKPVRSVSRVDPWDELDIDWDTFHPRARRLLNKPFFWDCTDEFSPHGNDTGADTLDEFQQWNRRNARKPAFHVVAPLLSYWGTSVIDWNLTKPADIDEMIRGNPGTMHINDQAIIGAAFAAIKFRGSCDAKTRDLAVRAIARQRIYRRQTGGSFAVEALRRLRECTAALRRASALS